MKKGDVLRGNLGARDVEESVRGVLGRGFKHTYGLKHGDMSPEEA
jgi:hypothetical protein